MLFKNFIVMAVAFGVHHGAILTCLGLSSTTVTEVTSGMGNSVLYVMFALMTLAGATGVLAILGLKRALLATAALMACYPLSYLVATLNDGFMNTGSETPFIKGAVVIGGILCGVAMGPYWAAQGVFYARSAAAYAAAAGTEVEAANSQFATIFAATLLGFELLLKTAASALLWDHDYEFDTPLMATLFTLSLVPIIGLFFIFEPPDLVPAAGTAVSSPGEMAAAPRSPPRTRLAPLSASPSFDSKLSLAKDAGVEIPETRGCCQQMLATLRFNVEQPTMLLLIPVNGGFGYASALLHGVINADLSSAILGKSSLGFLMAGSIGVAIMYVHMRVHMRVRACTHGPARNASARVDHPRPIPNPHPIPNPNPHPRPNPNPHPSPNRHPSPNPNPHPRPIALSQHFLDQQLLPGAPEAFAYLRCRRQAAIRDVYRGRLCLRLTLGRAVGRGRGISQFYPICTRRRSPRGVVANLAGELDANP